MAKPKMSVPSKLPSKMKMNSVGSKKEFPARKLNRNLPLRSSGKSGVKVRSDMKFFGQTKSSHWRDGLNPQKGRMGSIKRTRDFDGEKQSVSKSQVNTRIFMATKSSPPKSRPWIIKSKEPSSSGFGHKKTIGGFDRRKQNVSKKQGNARMAAESSLPTSVSRRFEAKRPLDSGFGDKKNSSPTPNKLLESVPTRFRLNEASNLILMDYTSRGRWLDVKMSEKLIAGLSAMGISNPNPMQLSVIPEIGKTFSCVLCAAETGSGKTLAYLLPILEKLKREESNDLHIRKESLPRAIILVPSNELVDQVHSVAKFLSHYAKLKVEKVSSAQDRKVRQNAIVGPIDLVISTPAQLLRSELGLEGIRHLAIDEGDTLLSDDFGEEIKELLGKIKPSMLDTTVVCSATIPIALTQLLEELFPKIIQLGSPQLHKASDRVDVRFINVQRPGNAKLQSCEELLSKNYRKTTLIFCNTMANACRIHRTMTENEQLMDTLTSVPSLLHGAIPERQRQSIIRRFKSGDIRYLVCTDLASRGLDTTQVGHVIMYDFARNTIDFIHRAGRTGRLEGSRGLVSCLISARDHQLARVIKQLIKSGQPLTSPK